MKIMMLILTFALALNAGACASTNRIFAMTLQHDMHLPSGGRQSLHGMVVFGSGPYFLEHIPMLQPPHDFQIVAQVVIKDSKGNIIFPDLSASGFTLKPAQNFSLNDYLNGTLKAFSGSIYAGSFEQNGQVISTLEDVQIEVTQILLSRQLPDESVQSVFTVDDKLNTYQTNIITPKNSVQVLKNLTLNKNLWCVTGPDFFEECH